MGTGVQRESLKRPKGTRDILPGEVALWQHVEQLAHKLFNASGYREIRTPVLEPTELFERGVGEETDIVHKEMYSFEKEERSLTLRPEGTAGVVRAYIEEGMSRWPKPVKLYYLGAMFRYERPQAGRQRQFHQLGMEVFGLDTPASDAEAIHMAWRLFEMLELPSLSLEINNIGDPESRQIFRNNFRELLKAHLPSLCGTCQRRYDTNPLRMLDCKVDACRAIYDGPEVTSFLHSEWTSEASQNHYRELTALLDALKIPYTRNVKLVRGLDYYTNTVFEITSTHLGAQNAVCGGGRYNGLMETLGGPATPAVGWALGMERLVSLVQNQIEETLDYYIVTDQHGPALELADRLRAKGHSVEVDLSGKGFGKQLESAGKKKAVHAVILGEQEISARQMTVKNMASGQQETLSLP